jgi:hypothetical protein
MAKPRPQAALHIDPELWKKVKIEAIKRDITVTDLVTIALQKEIGRSVK